MDLNTIFEFVKAVGMPIALVLFFVWSGEQREKRMAKRLDEVQDQHATLAKDTVANNTLALHEVKAGISGLHKAVENLNEQNKEQGEKLTETIRSLPCMYRPPPLVPRNGS